MDKNKVIKQNKFFRLFATSNTVNKIQRVFIMELNKLTKAKWIDANIATQLNYLSLEKEMDIILSKNKNFNNQKGKEKVANMIKVAALTRKGFIAGDIST